MIWVRSLTANHHQFDIVEFYGSALPIYVVYIILFFIVVLKKKRKEKLDSRENDTIFCATNVISSFYLVFVIIHIQYTQKEWRETRNCAKY